MLPRPRSAATVTRRRPEARPVGVSTDRHGTSRLRPGRPCQTQPGTVTVRWASDSEPERPGRPGAITGMTRIRLSHGRAAKTCLKTARVRQAASCQCIFKSFFMVPGTSSNRPSHAAGRFRTRRSSDLKSSGPGVQAAAAAAIMTYTVDSAPDSDHAAAFRTWNVSVERDTGSSKLKPAQGFRQGSCRSRPGPAGPGGAGR